eukprot:scaffold8496_cov66-Cyclotella_meneghiniana.AAC.22
MANNNGSPALALGNPSPAFLASMLPDLPQDSTGSTVKTPQRKSPRKSVTSQSLYEKERDKAEEFVTFMTSPSPSSSRSASNSLLRGSKSASPSPRKRFAKSPSKTYSARSSPQDETSSAHNNLGMRNQNNDSTAVSMETPSRRQSPRNKDAQSTCSKQQITIHNNNNKKQPPPKRRGISPNTHGMAIARSLVSPYIPSGSTATKYKSPCRSSAETVLAHAKKRRGTSHSPRGKIHGDSILSGGGAEANVVTKLRKKQKKEISTNTQKEMISLNRDSLPDLEFGKKNSAGDDDVEKIKSKSRGGNVTTSKIKSSDDDNEDRKVSCTKRGRKSCPPKFYHDEINRKDRESPSRLDSPSYGLLPAKKTAAVTAAAVANKVKKDVDRDDKTSCATAKAAAKPTHVKEKKVVEPKSDVSEFVESENLATNKGSNTEGKKRRRSRARKQTATGFSLVNIESLGSNHATPKSSPTEPLTSDESGKSVKRQNLIISNKELEEMISKKKRQSLERAKKAAAKKEAAKLAKLNDDATQLEENQPASKENEMVIVPLHKKKENAPPQGSDNLIVRLLTDSPSTESQVLGEAQPTEKDELVAQEINKYTSIGNTASNKKKQQADSKVKYSKAVSKQSSTHETASEGRDETSDSKGNAGHKSNTSAAGKVPPSRVKQKKPSKKKVSVDGKAQPESAPSEESTADQNISKTSPTKKALSGSPSRARRQAASSLEPNTSDSGKVPVVEQKQLGENSKPSNAKTKSQKKAPVGDKSQSNSALNEESTAVRESMRPSPAKNASPESPSHAKRQAASSLEVHVQLNASPSKSLESPRRRSKRKSMSSLEMVPSPQSPLQAKRLLSTLHGGIPTSTEQEILSETAELAGNDVPEVAKKSVQISTHDLDTDKPEREIQNHPEQSLAMSIDDRCTAKPEMEIINHTSVPESPNTTKEDKQDTQPSSKDVETEVPKESQNTDKPVLVASPKTLPEDLNSQNTTQQNAPAAADNATDSQFQPLVSLPTDMQESKNPPENECGSKVNHKSALASLTQNGQSPSNHGIPPPVEKDVDLEIAENERRKALAEDHDDEAPIVDIAPRMQSDRRTVGDQATLVNDRPHALDPSQLSTDQIQFRQMLERQYLEKRAEIGQYDLDFRINSDRLLALRDRIYGIDTSAAALHGFNEMYSPHQYESVERTYHSEIIASKRRRFRPPHYLDALDEFDVIERHPSRRRRHGFSGEARREQGSSRRTHHHSDRKPKRRYDDSSSYDEYLSDDSDLEFLRSSSRRGSQKKPRKEKHRSRRNDDINSSDSSEPSLHISHKRKSNKNGPKASRESSDDSKSEVKPSQHGSHRRIKKREKSPSQQKKKNSYASDTEYVESRHRRDLRERVNTPDKRKRNQHRDENIGEQVKSTRSRKPRSPVTPRRATAKQTSVLESVSPASKQKSRVESPRRTKVSHSSVLEGVGSDFESQHSGNSIESQRMNSSPPDVKYSDKKDSKDADNSLVVSKTNLPSKEKKDPKGEESIWLTGDGSDSDWDFDGPMILPPPPM